MMVDLNQLLGLILYITAIILVIVSISFINLASFLVVGIKLIKTLKKVDNVIDDVNEKMDKVDGVFDIIDKTADYASGISDKIISGISSFIGLLLRKKKGKSDDE